MSQGITTEKHINIFAWGSGIDGSLGLDELKNHSSPQVMKAAQFLNIVQISSGASHTLALTQDGNVYSFGSHKFGQLGRPGFNTPLPDLVPSLYNHGVVHIACGRYHNAVVTCFGQVFTWGRNDLGQLGLGNVGIHSLPSLVEKLSIDNINIKQVACGDTFTLCLDDTGVLYGWGDNSYSQLGRISSFVGITRPAEVPTTIRFTKIGVGAVHCVGLDAENYLYTWGSNSCGQLGFGFRSSVVPTPTCLKLPAACIDFACGAYHTLVLLQDGSVLAFGLGAAGQLGSGSFCNVYVPNQRIEIPPASKVFAGREFSACLCKNGDAYFFGSNDTGQLGIHDKKGKPINNLSRPEKITFFSDSHISVQSFSLGERRSFCIAGDLKATIELDPANIAPRRSSKTNLLSLLYKEKLIQFDQKNAADTTDPNSETVITPTLPEEPRDETGSGSYHNPPQSLTFFTGTWNLGAKKPSEPLSTYLSLPVDADVYALGFQEMIELSAAGVIEDKTKTSKPDSNPDLWKRSLEQIFPFIPAPQSTSRVPSFQQGIKRQKFNSASAPSLASAMALVTEMGDVPKTVGHVGIGNQPLKQSHLAAAMDEPEPDDECCDDTNTEKFGQDTIHLNAVENADTIDSGTSSDSDNDDDDTSFDMTQTEYSSFDVNGNDDASDVNEFGDFNVLNDDENYSPRSSGSDGSDESCPSSSSKPIPNTNAPSGVALGPSDSLESFTNSPKFTSTKPKPNSNFNLSNIEPTTEKNTFSDSSDTLSVVANTKLDINPDSLIPAMAANGHVIICIQQLFGLFLIIFVRKSLVPHMRNISSNAINIGMNTLIANKGGAAVRFELMGSSFCFVACHLASGLEKCNRRNKDHIAILNGLKLRHWNLCDHDYLFWVGDLNYRIPDVDYNIKRRIGGGQIPELANIEQLTNERRKGTVFRGFREGPLTFLPTYKYLKNSDVWDCKKYKSPAWCDRVLWISGDSCVPIAYRRSEMKISDHRPVSAIFDIVLCPPKIPEKIYNKVYSELAPSVPFYTPPTKKQRSPTVSDIEELMQISYYQRKIGNIIIPHGFEQDTTSVILSGFLTKRGKQRKSWKRRFFILTIETLRYYKNEEAFHANQDELGSLEMAESTVYIPVVNDGSVPTNHHFQIVVPNRVYYLCSDSDSDLNQWVNALRYSSLISRGFPAGKFDINRTSGRSRSTSTIISLFPSSSDISWLTSPLAPDLNHQISASSASTKSVPNSSGSKSASGFSGTDSSSSLGSNSSGSSYDSSSSLGSNSNSNHTTVPNSLHSSLNPVINNSPSSPKKTFGFGKKLKGFGKKKKATQTLGAATQARVERITDDQFITYLE